MVNFEALKELRNIVLAATTCSLKKRLEWVVPSTIPAEEPLKWSPRVCLCVEVPPQLARRFNLTVIDNQVMAEKRPTCLSTVLAMAEIGRGIFGVDFYSDGATEA